MNRQVLKEAIAKKLQVGIDNVDLGNKVKNNGVTKTYISVRGLCSSDNIAPSIFIGDILAKYGWNYETAAQHGAGEIVNRIREAASSAPAIEDIVFDRSMILSNAFAQVIGAERNADLLTRVPHRRLTDLAVIVRTQMNVGPSDVISSALISNRIIHSYEIDEEELLDAALRNTKETAGFRCRTMGQVLSSFGCELPLDEAPDDYPGLHVVTNDTGVNGATVLAFPDLLAKIIGDLGKDVFILPSSIHEILLVSGMDDADSLKAMVTSINRTEVLPEDVLTDSVYRFNLENKELQVIA